MVRRNRATSTAYHEAGHAVFTRRAGELPLEIFIDIDNPTEGESIDPFVWIPGTETDCVEDSPRGIELRRKFVYTAVIFLAGPLAEAKFISKRIPDGLWNTPSDDPFQHECNNDVHRAKDVIKKWYTFLNPTAKLDRLVLKHRANIVTHVKVALNDQSTWNAVVNVAMRLVTNRGHLLSDELRELLLPLQPQELPPELLKPLGQ